MSGPDTTPDGPDVAGDPVSDHRVIGDTGRGDPPPGSRPPPEPEHVDLDHAVGSGFRWSLASRVGGRIVTFGMGVVIARILVPEDFGVYAVALAAMNLLMTINDLGLIPSIVQSRQPFARLAPTATTLTLGFSVVLYATTFLLSPWFSGLMGSPEATNVVRVLTIEILIDGITAAPVAGLVRSFRQDRLAVAEFVGLPVTVIATVGLALNGAGPWALAWGHLLGTAVTGVLILWFARPLSRPSIDREVARELLVFSMPLATGFLVEAALFNADYLIVGNLLGATELGLYLLAFNISTWPVGMVQEAIRRVSIAGFARLHESGSDLGAGFARSYHLVWLAALPVSLGLALLAPELVQVVYGDKWAESAAPLRWLALLGVVRLASVLVIDVLVGAGRPWLSLRFQASWAVVLIPTLVLGATVAGISGVGMAHGAVGFLVAVPLGLWSVRRVGIDVRPVLRLLVRPLLAILLAGAAGLAVVLLLDGPILTVLVAGGVVVAVYAPTAMSWQEWRALAPDRLVARLGSTGSTG